jgi:hypothetical protein
VHLCLSAFTAHPIHLGSCRVTRQAGRAHTKGPGISVESIYRNRCSISRKTAVADPRTGERVAQLAQGREEKSIGQIATMTMLMLTRQLLLCNAMHSVCFITTSRAACEKRKKSQSHSGISINQSKCYRTYHANARPFCA